MASRCASAAPQFEHRVASSAAGVAHHAQLRGSASESSAA
jgi:hypothetical protein